jgi:hypothetical protein
MNHPRRTNAERSVIATAGSGEQSKDQRQGGNCYDAKAHQRYAERIEGAQLKHGELPTRLTPKDFSSKMAPL